MLEANIVQELDTSYELLNSLRDYLPQDGELYMTTLRSILNSARENGTIAQVIARARKHYAGAKTVFWDAASNVIWDLYSGADEDVDMSPDDEIDMLGAGSAINAGDHTDAQARFVSVAH
ncbi:hypothetical protein IW136_006565 [Coemansia sp. RSA 678]|nr:hypothetical protein IW136_006565 [Coemansia sp. RSA 678]